MRTTRGLIVVAVLGAVVLSGCDVNTGVTRSVAPDDLERQIIAMLQASTGATPDGMECPDALKGELGAPTRCTLTIPEGRYGVTVTVTGMDGTNVSFDATVDETPVQ